ncbi:Transposase-associated domain [Abeliophyllum distichum]|uniref:Transposase-associated domain n=1 Tax=Abeliophyllum distichum TaxID=126358 RepID=A0ABD1UQL1_9LAMI
MVRPLPNDRRFIPCLCRRCLTKAVQLVDDVKAHIFNFDFLETYEKWIHRVENQNEHVHARAHNEGIVGGDEIMDVLNDKVRDDSTCIDMFEALRLELYPGV